MTNTIVRNDQLIAPLVESDRCDRCGARAYFAVLIHNHTAPIRFCAHHAMAYEEKLYGLQLIAICDQRNMLVPVQQFTD